MGDKLIDKLRIGPGTKLKLGDRDPADKLGLSDKNDGAEQLAALQSDLLEYQARLWAEGKRSLLLVLQGIDGGGKDGTIRSVFSGVNPQGVRVAGFKAPAGAEAMHDYLWRVHQVLPEKGQIGIFNRSHYEDVLVVRVHSLVPEDKWRKRYRHIREWERMLVDEGTTIVKVCLHISKDEQRKRFEDRLKDPQKSWKFRVGDLEDRKKWDDYMATYEEAINETSTEWAPWYVVPGDRKWVRNVAVSTLLVDTLKEMNPQYPAPDPALKGIVIE
ncbi:MAG: polyphosphate kinase 2 family protein [Acidimicrobiia bacterium]